ncbi:MAG: hypothetical protein ACK5YI_14795 [Rhodospirillales bacterium]
MAEGEGAVVRSEVAAGRRRGRGSATPTAARSCAACPAVLCRCLTPARSTPSPGTTRDDGETEPGYDEWFRAKVEAAMNSTEPTIPHEEVMAEMRALLRDLGSGADPLDRTG